MNNDKYDLIVGLEIHIQTKTDSKMFCRCSSNYFNKAPNTQVCPVCMGMPGALPVPNRVAIQKCILLGLSLNCEIAPVLRFDRKHYFYPDLPKGYQISQYDDPLCFNGYLDITDENGNSSKVEIERIHQEEDVAKSTHHNEIDGTPYSLIDYNKSGVALIEIVTKPVIHSAFVAKEYASKIRQIARYLDISEADMEKGQMRCEPNISVQLKGSWEYKDGKIIAKEGYKLNPKVEVKNIGSISAVEKSILYEYERLIAEIESGNQIIQQTRGWNAVTNQTVFQRSKESAQDYRYFPEPDIPLIEITDEDIKEIKSKIIELPDQKSLRYQTTYGLTVYDSNVLTADKRDGEFFEELVSVVKNFVDEQTAGKEVAKWLTGVIFSIANEKGIYADELQFNREDFAQLIKTYSTGDITVSKAKEIFTLSIQGESIKKLLEEALSNKVDSTDLERIAKEVIDTNPKALADYLSGKETVIMFLVGQFMKATKGNSNPTQAKEILAKLLETYR